MATIIIPASNEEGYIGPCLDALLASGPTAVPVHVIVAANACRDATVRLARARTAGFEGRGWRLSVLDIAEPGKPNALNRADAISGPGARIYLDADVVVAPELVAQLLAVLARPEAAYASGTIRVQPTGSFVWRAYARFWATVPFLSEGVPGCGLFAVNERGRARWGVFPDIISDDTYVRLLFAPDERHSVPATYDWPVVSGFARLVRVRRRQDRGVDEIRARFPELMANDEKRPMGLAGAIRRLLANPVGFVAYCSVALAVRFGPRVSGPDWARGR